MSFEIVQRQGLIVWLYTLKHLKSIRKYGHVHYISKKLKYVVLYVDADQAIQTAEQLERYHFVRQVEQSHRDEIDMSFKDSIPNRIDPNLKAVSEDKEHDFSVFISSVAASLDLPTRGKPMNESVEDDKILVEEVLDNATKEAASKTPKQNGRKSNRNSRRSNRNRKNQKPQKPQEPQEPQGKS